MESDFKVHCAVPVAAERLDVMRVSIERERL
jgi:hypothetical protein